LPPPPVAAACALTVPARAAAASVPVRSSPIATTFRSSCTRGWAGGAEVAEAASQALRRHQDRSFMEGQQNTLTLTSCCPVTPGRRLR
jgi:hypothetical protein